MMRYPPIGKGAPPNRPLRKPDRIFRKGLSLAMDAGLLPRGEILMPNGKNQQTRGGLDWIIRTPTGEHIGIDARVEFNDWEAITIREQLPDGSYDTELLNTYRTIMFGGTVPTYTVEICAARDTEDTSQIYVMPTEDLFLHVVRGLDAEDRPIICTCCDRSLNFQDGARYVIVALSPDAAARRGTRDTAIAHGLRVGKLHDFRVEQDSVWGSSDEPDR